MVIDWLSYLSIIFQKKQHLTYLSPSFIYVASELIII